MGMRGRLEDLTDERWMYTVVCCGGFFPCFSSLGDIVDEWKAMLLLHDPLLTEGALKPSCQCETLSRGLKVLKKGINVADAKRKGS